ncbi:MAG TPA: WXG100 family type VII secretion target [Nocardioides sp.]|nr:WXG100 family type VII secretion target [Nocardioides sp.]
MDHDDIRVSHAGLDRAAEGLQLLVRRIDERLDRLAAELAPLASDWTGHAQQSYVAARARWEEAMREMQDLLGATARTVHESNEAYRAADRRGAEAFDG